MADQNFQDKTEKATPKKKSEARKRGQVAKSREVTSVAVLIAGLTSFIIFGAFMYSQIQIVTKTSFSMIKAPDIDLNGLIELSRTMVFEYIMIVLPIMMTVVIVGIFSNILQIGFLFSWEAMTPNLSKLDPIKGVGKLFSKQSLVEVLKSLLKLALVGSIAYWTVDGESKNFMALGNMEVANIGLYILKVILKVFYRVCIAMILLAIMDYIFQKWNYEEQLKMTKQEVKEEFKRTEGDPIVKSRIRRVQQEVARRRMMQEVPNADVVVTNPIHLAIAIKYDATLMTAPRVVAKGAEKIAEKIKKIAKEENIPIVENKVLARDLYKNIDIGEEVSSEFYQAVAEVLAYVYRLKGKVA